MNIFKKIYGALLLREAVRKADKAHAVSSERFYVLPADITNKKKLVVVDRKNFRILKRKGYASRNAFCNHLMAECFYHTPDRGGNGEMSPIERRKRTILFYKWLSS